MDGKSSATTAMTTVKITAAATAAILMRNAKTSAAATVFPSPWKQGRSGFAAIATATARCTRKTADAGSGRIFHIPAGYLAMNYTAIQADKYVI